MSFKFQNFLDTLPCHPSADQILTNSRKIYFQHKKLINPWGAKLTFYLENWLERLFFNSLWGKVITLSNVFKKSLKTLSLKILSEKNI